MKTKIVLWGENEKAEKILLGIELLESENLIRINVIPEVDATEIFYNQMMNQWREGQLVPMPESTVIIDRPLSMTDGLLPDNIKTQRQDILARAKTEWHFVILSSKLYEAYADEISLIKERIEELSDFDEGIWEEMKSFWRKVQDQVQEKNLFREHAAELRTKTNELFDALKSLKSAMNDEFEKISKEHLDVFFQKLNDIEERIEKGLGLQPIFNELKGLQNKFKNTQFTRKHHNDVWKRLDGAFKKVKEKKFGKTQSGGNSAIQRLTRRQEGLAAAINKMEQSINRDIRDKQFQEKRIGTTDGQLEMQIRQAKMAMIEERLGSKQAKLDDMLKTRTEIEKKIESEKARDEKKEEQRQQAKDIKEAQKSVKENIAKEIEDKSEELKEKDEQLQKAAEEIIASKIAAKNAALKVEDGQSSNTPTKNVGIAEESAKEPVDPNSTNQKKVIESKNADTPETQQKVQDVKETTVDEIAAANTIADGETNAIESPEETPRKVESSVNPAIEEIEIANDNGEKSGSEKLTEEELLSTSAQEEE